MRVMGIDPGSKCTGCGVIDEVNNELKVVYWGSIKTKPRQSFPERLKFIYDELVAVIKEYNPEGPLLTFLCDRGDRYFSCL